MSSALACGASRRWFGLANVCPKGQSASESVHWVEVGLFSSVRSRPNMAREKILITGASGFVGRALCRQLEVKGHSLKRVLRKPSPHSQSPTYSSEEFIIPDLNAVVHWRAAMEDVDVVFHLAARVHVMKENHPNAASLYQETNCEGTRKLGQAAADAGVRRFIFVSTVKVHGEKNLRNQKGEPIPFSETQPPNPADPYAQSKWDAEKGLHEISRRSGMEIVILRPPLIYGPGVGGNFLKLLGLLDKKVPLPLKSVHSRRSILYVGNLVDALVTTIYNQRASERTFLISDGYAPTIPELLEKLARSLNKKPRLFRVPVPFLRWVGSLTGRSASIDRLTSPLIVDTHAITSALGWAPPFTLKAALKETVDWYMKSDCQQTLW